LIDNTGEFVNSFTTTRDRVEYIALEFSGSDENDEVSVEAFLVQTGVNASRTRINDVTSIVNIQPSGFVIRPTTRIIGGDDDIRLYIEDREGNPLIKDTSDFDYRVAWSTPGQHGAFDGTQRNVSFVNQDNVIYSALDTDVDTGQETVTAQIFARRKGETGSFTFLGDTSATIIISNFEIVTYEVDAVAYFFEFFNSIGQLSGQIRGGFIVPREERAVSYSIEILEYVNGNNFPSPNTGRVFTWDNDLEFTSILRVIGEDRPTGLPELAGNGPGSNGDFLINLQSLSIGLSTGNIFFARNYEQFRSSRGRARVTITLDGRL